MPAQVIQLRPQAQLLMPYGRNEEEFDPFYGRDPRKISELRKDYGDYLETKTAENQEMAEARRYYHGVQWTKEEVDKLAARNQPVVTYNRIGRKINGIVGLLERLRQDPKAYPRTPSGAAGDGAELATQTLNYGLDACNWKSLSAEAARQCAIGGISGCELIVTPGDRGDPDISFGYVDQREFFYDPGSSRHDFSDATFKGTSRWMKLSSVLNKWRDYPEPEKLRGLADTGWDDFSRGDERIKWARTNKKQLRILDHWYLVGDEWLYCIYTGNCILEEGLSPFVNEKGESVDKYLMFSAGVDHEDDRYGFFRDLRGPQDEINHRRSKALHLLNTRRVLSEKGAVDDPELARREVAKSDGYIEVNKDYRFEIEQVDTDFQGNVSLLQEAKTEFDEFGPTSALLGQNIDAKTGRAISLLQMAGIAELGPYILSVKDWKIRCYRALWNAQQQFWTAERFIRVTDNDGMQQFVQLNGWERNELGMPVMINQLAALDVDIILDEGPDTINTMAEAFDTLLALAQQGANIPPQVIIELSNLPASIKKKVMGYINQVQNSPAQQMATELQLKGAAAQIDKTVSETERNKADAMHKVAQAQTAGAVAPQVDTPADLAKAAKDLAQAHQISSQTQRDNIPDPNEHASKIATVMKDAAQAHKLNVEAAQLQAMGGQAGYSPQEQALGGPGLYGMDALTGAQMRPGPRPLAPT